MSAVPLDVLKLLLGILAFVVVGWYGARDRRVGGVLLTFPLLNAIAMLTGADPIGIAGTIYLVVMWNCILFLLAIYRYEALPPLPATMNGEIRIILRVAVWVVLWAAGAALLARFRDALSFAGWLFVIDLAAAAFYIWLWWRPASPAAAPTFAAMWLNTTGLARILCFVLAFVFLSAVAHVASDSRWIGWASALPLAGFFALATLAETQDRQKRLSLADTVLLGPLLVIPFNWLLARAILALRAHEAGMFAEIVMVVAFWALAVGVVFSLVPFARWRDRLCG